MGDQLLLHDASRCPRCFRQTVRRDIRRCTSCFAYLLFEGDTACWLEDQNLFGYYVHTAERGWVHADHLRREKQEPNERFPKPIDTTPQRPSIGPDELKSATNAYRNRRTNNAAA